MFNCFVQSFNRIVPRVQLMNSRDRSEVLDTSILLLRMFVNSPDTISEVNELSFFDSSSKLFWCLSKVVEGTKQMPHNNILALVVTNAYIFVGLPNYQFKKIEEISDDSDHWLSLHRKDKSSGRPNSGSRKVRSLNMDVLEMSPSEDNQIPIPAQCRKNALHFLCLLVQVLIFLALHFFVDFDILPEHFIFIISRCMVRTTSVQ